ncbi:MAG: T9SS type A sorting domain-containing protein, partial [Flavobacteriales bacterium]|nr:T9SS type A sorting domain-containing protein [Flavobacteriales bacterium]
NTNETSINNISVFPNPVKNTLNIQGEMELVEIFDVFGKLVLNSTNNIINTSDLAEGVYVVNINTNNMIVTKRITVTK